MYLNYLRTAFSVFMRRKAFSALSLLGTMITLSILIVVVAIADNILHPNGAERTNGSHLMIERIQVMNKERTSVSRSGPGYKFLNDYVRQMNTPKVISIFSDNYRNSIYQNGEKIELLSRFTDGHYWSIYDFTLLEGRLINHADELQANQVAVISKSTRDKMFPNQSALGKSISLANVNYQIIGVVADESGTQKYVASDVWMPNSTNIIPGQLDGIMGGFVAALVAENPSDFDKIQAEYQHVLSLIDIDPIKYAFWESYAMTMLDQMAMQFLGVTDDDPQPDTKAFIVISVFAMVVFMLLPTLNLVNLNISRIMERSSEIGVKKSFGATTSTLVKQFVFENILLTLIGGLLSFIAAFFFLRLIELSAVFPHANFAMSWTSLLLGLGITLFFGCLSGVIPAWKMARMHPVYALKGAIA